MKAKIDAASHAVKPGSSCTACVVASGSDLDSIRAILGKSYNPRFGCKGTLFVTPGTDLWEQGLKEVKATAVSTLFVLPFTRYRPFLVSPFCSLYQRTFIVTQLWTLCKQIETIFFLIYPFAQM